MAEQLAFHSQQLGFSPAYRGVTVKLPADQERALTTVEIASRLDRDPAYRSSLIAALKPVIADATLLILPGILGMKTGDDDLRCFEQDIGCLICELATMPPSVPGLRLLYRLERYLASQGVELCTGFAVQELCREGDRCTGVVLDTPGRPRRIYADSVVLACGRFSQLLQDRIFADESSRADNSAESGAPTHQPPRFDYGDQRLRMRKRWWEILQPGTATRLPS